MSGVVITPDRAARWSLSEPYLEETLGFLVPDHARGRFLRWSDLGDGANLRVLTANLDYFADQLAVRLPRARVEVVEADAALFTNGLRQADALAVPAERGFAITLLYPAYTVVVPQPGAIRMPLTYPLAPDERWREFVNTWLRLKKGDGTIDRLYERWILGRSARSRIRRWSVLHDVLGW
jgi:ABC-type amino acid transport substrate-binding protein